MDKIMVMSTAEYKALFGNKNPNEVSNEDIKKQEKNIGIIEDLNQIKNLKLGTSQVLQLMNGVIKKLELLLKQVLKMRVFNGNISV